MDEGDASDRTRRCLALALVEVRRHPDPECVRTLERLRQDFVCLRGAMLASRLDPALAQRRMRALGAAAEELLHGLTVGAAPEVAGDRAADSPP